MIKDFCLAWEANHEVLKEYFATHFQEEYCDSYESLLTKTFELVINPYLESKNEEPYDIKNECIHVIDDGDYQGTYVFLIHKDVYQPDIDDYIVTYTWYGSCSGCDTLCGIHCYDTKELPSEEQVKEYMSLCLHMIQHCKPLY